MTACNHASVVIDAPMALVWDLTNDVASWPTLFPDYAATEILDTTGETTRFTVTMRPDERGGSHGWTAERVVDRAARTARMHQVAGHAFDFLHVHWRYRQLDEGVELNWGPAFRAHHYMPNAAHAMVGVLQRTVPLQLAHVKQQVERAAEAARGQPFRMLLRIDVHPGREPEFEREWRAIAEGIAGHAGHRGQSLMRSATEDATYFVLSEWVDAESFRTFELSEQHVHNRRRLDEYRHGGSMQTMTLVAAVPAAGG